LKTELVGKPLWLEDFFGWKTHSSHFDLADGQLSPCFEEHPIRATDRRLCLTPQASCKVKIAGEWGICALDFFFHTGSKSSLERRV
jgi:hypothetical protein